MNGCVIEGLRSCSKMRGTKEVGDGVPCAQSKNCKAWAVGITLLFLRSSASLMTCDSAILRLSRWCRTRVHYATNHEAGLLEGFSEEDVDGVGHHSLDPLTNLG